MSTRRRKKSYRCQSAEIKTRWHRAARCRSAKPQIARWLASQGVDLTGMDYRKIFRTFLERLGVFRIGVSINYQIEQLYTNAEFDIIGPQSPGFYMSPEWLCLRSQVIATYGAVCMRCQSTSSISVDHIYPRSLYPNLELEFDNMQVLCRSCNSSKTNRSTTDYRPKAQQDLA